MYGGKGELCKPANKTALRVTDNTEKNLYLKAWYVDKVSFCIYWILNTCEICKWKMFRKWLEIQFGFFFLILSFTLRKHPETGSKDIGITTCQVKGRNKMVQAEGIK